jgi:hypothetical protein
VTRSPLLRAVTGFLSNCSDPQLATRRVRADPAGVGPGDWSLVTGHWSLVTGHWSLVTGQHGLEADPRFEWDEQRLASIPDVIRAVLPGSTATDGAAGG